MKTVILLTLCASLCGAASFGVTLPIKATAHAIAHPVAAYHETSGEKWLNIAALVTLESANAVDYATTLRGPILNPGQYCENNPLFTRSRCVINAPRFTGVKIVVAAIGGLQFAPRLWGWDNPTWNRSFTLVDFGIAIPLFAVDIGNIRALTK